MTGQPPPAADGLGGAGRPEGADPSPATVAPGAVLLHISVVYAPAQRELVEVNLQLPAGATVQSAVEASGLRQRFAEIDLEPGSVGVWGRKAPLDHVLREADRVEIWRPLRVDPKLARRERFQSQGAGQAGLFKRRRPGAKPGY